MRRILLIFIIISTFLLSGCINTGGVSYIESVDCYVNSQLITGKLQYYQKNNNQWLDYSKDLKDKTNVYYTFDVLLEDSIEIIINFHNPKLVIKDIKVVYNKDLNYNTNITNHFQVLDQEDKNNKVIINIESLDGSYNTLTIPSWLSNHGLKYQGIKHPNGNYTIMGVHFNII